MVSLLTRTVKEAASAVLVLVDRHTLYKRRWRARAEDGTDIAISLEIPVNDGAFLAGKDGRIFQIQQKEEDVLAIPLPKTTELAAKVGWYLGNQHLPVEVREEEIILEDIPTLAKSLNRIGIPYTQRREVFHCKMHSHQH